MVKVESKEKLAKLLAVEDLDIQHQQVQTAMFDVQNRVLILPTWKDMPDHVYDLLVGHEIGHALFTPTDSARVDKIVKATSKDCINIIEDARIERLVKRRYPGLKKQFYKGYNNLIERNFFGLDDRDINTSVLLDRINIHFKCPTYMNGDIQFNEEEQLLVDRIAEAKSFIDVEEIAIDLHTYIKENEKEQPQDTSKSDYFEDDDSEEFFDEQQQSFDSEEGERSEDEDEDEDEDGEETDSDSDNDSDEETESDSGNDSDEETLSGGNKEEEEVTSQTQRCFDENMLINHIDTKTNNTYVTIPENINWKEAIIDYKVVHNTINRHYNHFQESNHAGLGYDEVRFKEITSTIHKQAKVTLQKLKKESFKTVNHIAMEFERKKCADIYKRTLITKSGILDTNKLFSAKYNEDVFRKNVKVAEGKNHGLVMFIDWSGSMGMSISDCIKQVIELTFFCKKVNIPFDVYSFSDSMWEEKRKNSFEYRHNDLCSDPKVQLRNYLSSRMSTKEYNNALLNMCIFINRFRNGYNNYSAPREDELCSTPLNGAILLSEHVIREFKRKNNIESVHAVWLTDGDGNRSDRKYVANSNQSWTSIYESTYRHTAPNVYIKDKKTKKDYLVYGSGTAGAREGITPTLFKIVKSRLGINVIGFFVVPSFTLNNLYRFVPRKDFSPTLSWQERQKLEKEWVRKSRKDNYFVRTEVGYDEYYVINSVLADKKPVAEITEKMTANKMANIFSKKNNQFKAKRIILSKFVDLITAK